MSVTTERILVVDDEEQVRDLLQTVLQDAGHAVRAVDSAVAAVDCLHEEAWDLVITDLLMPKMSGQELLEQLGRDHPATAVVIMTGHPTFESARAAVRAQASDYLEKPFTDVLEVRTRIEDILRARRRRLNKALVFKEITEQNRRLETEKTLLARKVTVTQRNLRAQLQTLQQSREIFYTDLSRVMAIIDNLADGIVFTDPGGKVILINPAAGEMLGIPSFTALGKLLPMVEGNRNLLDALGHHRAVNIGDQGEQAELSTRGEDGDAHYTIHTNAVHDFQGKLSGILSLVRDVSIRRKTEHLKNQFLSIVAHELRTPLTTIKAFATILEKGIYGELPEAQGQMVANILSQSDRLGHEIDKIINLGRLDAADFVPDLQRVVAADILNKVTFPFTAEASEKGVCLTYTDMSDGAEVYADKNDIRRAVRALTENALKFTPEGGSIAIRLMSDDEGVTFEVFDTGIGIAREDQAVIFEKFIQLENPLTRTHGGSGLGLSFAAEIIEAHRSRIEVESDVGEGATFRFRLPHAWSVDQGAEQYTASTESEPL